MDHLKEELTAFFEPGVYFEGKISFKGLARINGKLKGSVHSEGVVIVGESAEIEADFRVKKLIVLGKLKGDIQATQSVFMKPPAVFEGTVEAPVLKIDEGVVFKGHSKVFKS